MQTTVTRADLTIKRLVAADLNTENGGSQNANANFLLFFSV